jgi:hypothetical protein
MDFFLFRAMRLPFLILVLFLAAQASWAAEAPKNTASAGPAGAAANPAADTDSAAQLAARAAIKAGATPVEVELEGTDALGAKLAFQLKDLLNSGTLFLLSSQDVPKIRILLATAAEFPSRPEVGSVYSAIWLYYEKPTSFNSYLAREVGVITPAGAEDLAARLAERTAGIAAKYAYIFEKR